MVEGPVHIEALDGSVVESDRFLVAICTCRRSKNYPSFRWYGDRCMKYSRI
jgi:hypothetical protein